MPKKRPRPDLSLARHVDLTGGAPFSLEMIPAEAWKCFCVVAWKRLEECNPRWAELIDYEFWNFRQTWVASAFIHRYHGNVGENWIRDAYQYMLNTSLKKGQQPLHNPRAILADYEKLLSAVRTSKKENRDRQARDRRQRWRKDLQTILDQQPYRDETRTHAIVTEELIDTAMTGTASEVALEILRLLDGLSPSTLQKKLFPKLRKRSALSPLELWREKRPKPLRS